MALEVFVSSFPSPGPVAVVVHYEYSFVRKFRIEPFQFMVSGFIPVSVEPQYRNARWQCTGNRFFNLTLQEK